MLKIKCGVLAERLTASHLIMLLIQEKGFVQFSLHYLVLWIVFSFQASAEIVTCIVDISIFVTRFEHVDASAVSQLAATCRIIFGVPVVKETVVNHKASGFEA